jgi:hypothetical protein
LEHKRRVLASASVVFQHEEELLWCCKHAKGGVGGVMKLYLLGSCFRRHADFCWYYEITDTLKNNRKPVEKEKEWKTQEIKVSRAHA